MGRGRHHPALTGFLALLRQVAGAERPARCRTRRDTDGGWPRGSPRQSLLGGLGLQLRSQRLLTRQVAGTRPCLVSVVVVS
jgi:hypothetical protein